MALKDSQKINEKAGTNKNGKRAKESRSQEVDINGMAVSGRCSCTCLVDSASISVSTSNFIEAILSNFETFQESHGNSVS